MEAFYLSFTFCLSLSWSILVYLDVPQSKLDILSPVKILSHPFDCYYFFTVYFYFWKSVLFNRFFSHFSLSCCWLFTPCLTKNTKQERSTLSWIYLDLVEDDFETFFATFRIKYKGAFNKNYFKIWELQQLQQSARSKNNNL